VRTNLFIIIGVACLATAGCGGGGGSDSNPPTITSLADVPAVMDYYHVPGVSIALIKNRNVERLLVFGIRDQNTNEPVTESTQFQAGSISKAVAAAVALKLVQDGRIDLDSDINGALESWKLPSNSFTMTRPATLRMLLSHTAGTTVHGFPGYHSTDRLPLLVQILDGTAPANTPPIVVDKVPGASFRYSGGGYVVMQQAIVDLSGKKFAAVAKESVLDALAMTDSTYDQPLPAASLAFAASAHDANGRVLEEGSHVYPELAAAGLWTTPRDLARFLIEIQASFEGQSNLLMSRELASAMLTPSSSSSYGLGFEITSSAGEEYFGHGGVNAGFHAYMVAHKSKGVGAVVMTNADNGSQVIRVVLPVIAQTEQWPDFQLN
jgi:CubicO group peptidase (beta-lactamase class C family)